MLRIGPFFVRGATRQSRNKKPGGGLAPRSRQAHHGRPRVALRAQTVRRRRAAHAGALFPGSPPAVPRWGSSASGRRWALVRLGAVGHGRRQRSLLDHFCPPAPGAGGSWGARRGADHRERGRAVGPRECSIIWGKELASPGRDGCGPVPPRGRASRSKRSGAGAGSLACWRRLTEAPRRRSGRPARGQRFPPGLPLGAGALPREELAVGRHFWALGRVRELDLYDFGVSGEETVSGGQLSSCTPGPHAHPPHVREGPRGPRRKEAEAKTGSEAGTRGKSDKEWDAIRGRAAAFPPSGPPRSAGPAKEGQMLSGRRRLQPRAASGPCPMPLRPRLSDLPQAQAAVVLHLISPPTRETPLASLAHFVYGCPFVALAWRALGPGAPASGAGSYLIARTPTPVFCSWSPFPVICKTQAKENCEKRWPSNAQGAAEATWGEVNATLAVWRLLGTGMQACFCEQTASTVPRHLLPGLPSRTSECGQGGLYKELQQMDRARDGS